MISKTINIEGKDFLLMKMFSFEKTKYCEYRCEKLGKVRFFEIKNGDIKSVGDIEKLKRAIQKNYILEE